MAHSKYVNFIALFVVVVAVPILVLGLQQRQIFQNSAQTRVLTPKNIIEQVSISVPTSGKARLLWHTNVASTSLVMYGNSGNFLSVIQTESVQPTLEHAIELSNLRPNTTYYFRITSYDEAGNSYTSSIGSFTSQ